tara:strand:+ start:247 stop:396 length:150 start_codon:yes stop_codon:yes gene_type:complete
METIPFISILVLMFSLIIVGEIIKLKKEVRRLSKAYNILKAKKLKNELK